jgi:hypothetical protein
VLPRICASGETADKFNLRLVSLISSGVCQFGPTLGLGGLAGVIQFPSIPDLIGSLGARECERPKRPAKGTAGESIECLSNKPTTCKSYIY